MNVLSLFDGISCGQVALGYTRGAGTDTARKKMIGNGWHVDTLEWIFSFIPN